MIRVGSPHTGVRPESLLGGEVYERMLLRALPAHGVRVLLGFPRGRRPSEVHPDWELSLLRPSRGLRWYVAPAAFVPYTVRLLRRDRVDVLRGHSVRFTAPSLFAARSLVRSRVPIVLHHLHTDAGWERFEGSLLRAADAVVTISERSRDQLHSFGVDPRRISVVYPGVERQPHLSRPRMGDAWPPSPSMRLLFLGRLVPRKRPEVAIDALAELRRGGIDAQLVVAGGGELRPLLERRAHARGVAGAVRWLGVVSEAQKWALYEEADVLLFPSALEGFGFVAAEAQLAGLPTIVAEGTSAAEIVRDGETGAVAASSGPAFADAIRRVADPARHAEFAAAARIRAERFSWHASAAGVAAAYRDAANSTSGRDCA